MIIKMAPTSRNQGQPWAELDRALRRIGKLENVLERAGLDAGDEVRRIQDDLAGAVGHTRTRLTQYAEVLTALAKDNDPHSEDFLGYARRVGETAGRTLGVERTSIWLFNQDRSKLLCKSLYVLSNDCHSDGAELEATEYPAYFAALNRGRCIAADDAHTDPATREFSEGYLTPLNICSMLDAPMRRGEEVFGVVCHEAVGAPRRWADEERGFAASVADHLTLALEFCARTREERLERGRNHVLELLAGGENQREVLDALVRVIEDQRDDLRCGIMLLDEKAQRLGYAAAPNLPRGWRDATDGLGVGEGVCGQAVLHNERTLTEDIATDSRCEAFGRVAREHGLAACWSEPIVIEGRVVGTFAVYSRRPGRPDNADLKMIETASRLAAIAIERSRKVEEKHRLEERLRLSQKMEAVGQLAGGVAHDFNNLLTAILGNAEMLLETVKASPDSAMRTVAMASVGEIHRAGHRASTLTRQLLAFGRKQVQELEVLDVNALIDGLRTMLIPLLGERTRLSIDSAPNLSPVYADAGQLEQVLLNLILNAQDAMPDGGQLTIATRNAGSDERSVAPQKDAGHGSDVLIQVTDTGTGMTPETLERIFDPFFSTKALGRGTGLGLATVYGIVSQLGGHTDVTSEPGRGSSFRIYIPASTHQPRISRPGLLADIPRGEETVVVCEDDEMVLSLTCQVLEASGYTVLAALSGESALEQFAGHDGPIHLLLTDTILPGLSGTALAKRLMAERPELRVLYVSGYTEDVVASHGIVGDAPTFLQKPFSPTTLLQRVRAVLEEGDR